MEARHQFGLFTRSAREYMRNRGIRGLGMVVRGWCGFDFLGLMACGLKGKGVAAGAIVTSLALGIGIAAAASGTVAAPLVLLGSLAMIPILFR